MIINEGIGDVFRDMPSLGQFKDDVYRYLVYHNSPLVDKIDKDYFNIERVNDVNNPRYFIGGPNKNRFQLPNRIIQDKTKLYFRFYVNLSSKDMLLEIGINLKDDSNNLMKIEPYRNNIKILDFINKWSNYNWSNEMKLAINDLSKKLNLDRKQEVADIKSVDTLKELFKLINLKKSELAKKILEHDNQDNTDDTKAVEDQIEELFKTGKFDANDYAEYIDNNNLSDAGKDLLNNDKFIDAISLAFRDSLKTN